MARHDEKAAIAAFREVRRGYVTSAISFAAITALWAWIVRDDPYYAMTQLFGFTLPAATVFYLAVMPLIGLVAGRWRYHANGGAGPSVFARAFARASNFLYAHSLIVLFTVAMVTDRMLGFNIDEGVRNIDDSLFDIGSRFAPWLSAYLAGFNIGRAMSAPA